MNKNDERPIIIRRGGPPRKGHHGGAWKLAYADFMTAMMAFFLLMWLLGSVNTTELAGIADYFKTPLKTALLGGKRTSDGSSLLQGGGFDMSHSDGDTRRSDGMTQPVDRALPQPGRRTGDPGINDVVQLHDLQLRLEKALDANPALRPYRNQIMIELAHDGLRIQIVDTQNRPMFANASAEVQPYMRDILREIGRTLNDVPNRVVLSGHTDARPYAGGAAGYSNWELSADRANASRRDLVAGGMDESKVLRVIGLASSQDLNRQDPFDPVNRRISIIVLNHQAESEYQKDDLKGTDVPDRKGAAAGILTRVDAPIGGNTMPAQK